MTKLQIEKARKFARNPKAVQSLPSVAGVHILRLSDALERAETDKAAAKQALELALWALDAHQISAPRTRSAIKEALEK